MRQEGILRQLREHALRLTTALYRVSERFPEQEPLRRHCREYADEILARISSWDQGKKANKITGRIDALHSLLLVAAETGWVRGINIEVLTREYAILRDRVEQTVLPYLPQEEARKEGKEGKEGEVLESLDIPAGEAGAAFLLTVPACAERAGVTSTAFAGRFGGVEQKREADPAEAAPDPYPEPTPRQKKILRHIADAKQAKISDFFPVLSGVSVKTIQRDLSELVSKNVLKREGEKRWTTYMLA